MLHHDIGMLWVKLIGIGSKEYICVIKKFGVLKFQFHILHKLLIGRCFLYHKIHILVVAGGHERNIQAQVQVASIQTITHRANIEVARSLPIRFIIIDEAHHSTANSYKKLWELYPSAKKLGVTATPWRMNHQGFAKIYDKLILSRSIKEFIEQGWLSPYCFYSIGSGSKVTQEINSINEFDIEGDYKISALEKTIDQSAIRAQLLDSYLKFAKGKKGIIY